MERIFKNKKVMSKMDRRKQKEESDDEEYDQNKVVEQDTDSEPETERQNLDSCRQTHSPTDSDQHQTNETAKLREHIQSMPMGQLEKLKKKLGVRLFNKTFFAEETMTNKQCKNAEPSISMNKSITKAVLEGPQKRNPKRPREISSKKPVSKFRRVIEVKKKERFDPRFSTDAGGDFDDAKFRKDYSFLNEMKKTEILELKKAYRSARHEDPDKAARIKTNILRLENQLKSVSDANLMQELRTELRKTNIERMNQGQRPLLLNNREMKRRFMEKKIEISSSSNGNVRPYLQRKLERFNEKKQEFSNLKNESFSSTDQ